MQHCAYWPLLISYTLFSFIFLWHIDKCEKSGPEAEVLPTASGMRKLYPSRVWCSREGMIPLRPIGLQSDCKGVILTNRGLWLDLHRRWHCDENKHTLERNERLHERITGYVECEWDETFRGVTAFLQSQWWSLLFWWRGPPGDWCICLRQETAAAAGLAPQMDSLRPPPVTRTPSPDEPARIPLCPGTSSQLRDCWCSALHRKLLATGSWQGSGKHRLFCATIISCFGNAPN